MLLQISMNVKCSHVLVIKYVRISEDPIVAHVKEVSENWEQVLSQKDVKVCIGFELCLFLQYYRASRFLAIRYNQYKSNPCPPKAFWPTSEPKEELMVNPR